MSAFRKFDFTELFNLEEIQRLQDQFAQATGVAALITRLDGTPITQPSNLSSLCILIRSTETGKRNCRFSNNEAVHKMADGSTIYPCLSGELWEAKAGISVGGRLVANWLIGYIKSNSLHRSSIVDYARLLQIDSKTFFDAYDALPSMTEEKFNHVTQSLTILAGQLSGMAYQNIRQDRLIKTLKKTKESLSQKNNELQSVEEEIRATNEELVASNEALEENIRELEGAKQEVYEKEKWLRESQRIGRIGTYELNIDLNQWKSSEVLDEIFGITSDYVKNIDGWLSLIHPEHVVEIRIYFAQHEVQEYDLFDKEYKIIRQSDGETRWVLGRGELRFNKLGYPIQMIGTIQDITEQKESKQALKNSADFNQSLLQTIPFGIDVIDESGNILFHNELLQNMIGTEIIGKKCWEIFSDHKTQCTACPLKTSIKVGETHIIESQNLLNGKTLEISQTGMMFQGKKAILEVLHDITKRKTAEGELLVKNAELQMAEEEIRITNEELFLANKNLQQQLMELEQAKSKAEESNRLKTAFLRNISHEIRTPLNAIVGFTDLITNFNHSREQTAGFAEIVHQASHQLTSVITDIINMATVEARQLKPFMKQININNFMQKITLQFIQKFEKKGIEFSCTTFPLKGHPILITDEIKLHQIFTCLLENALKFTEKGKVEFGCLIQNKFLEFYFKDTGIGIPLELQEVIFENFRQGECSLSREYGGNGLGLSISKAYVEMLGGKIWVKSEIHQGTTFFFTIPHNSKFID